MTGKTHYDVLGVSRQAAPKDVRQAYLDRCKVLHPDRFDPVTQAREWKLANELTQELNDSYAVLRDEGKRQQYDEAIFGRSSPNPRPHSAAQSAGNSSASKEYKSPPRRYHPTLDLVKLVQAHGEWDRLSHLHHYFQGVSIDLPDFFDTSLGVGIMRERDTGKLLERLAKEIGARNNGLVPESLQTFMAAPDNIKNHPDNAAASRKSSNPRSPAYSKNSIEACALVLALICLAPMLTIALIANLISDFMHR